MPQTHKTNKSLLMLVILYCLYGGHALAEDKKGGGEQVQNSQSDKTSVDAEPDKEAMEEDSELVEVLSYAQIGAPGLALRMMDRIQAQFVSQQERWMQWEKQRLQIYERNQSWDDIIQRVKQLPSDLPLEFGRWAATQMAQAYLEQQQGRLARGELRRLILSASGEEEQGSLDWLQQWRRLIIQSYIAEGISEDALTSILRYQQDYRYDKKEILLLRARVLLMNKRPTEAAELLVSHTDDQMASILLLLAQLRSETRNPIKVLQASLKLLKNDKLDRNLRGYLWAVVAEAALQADDRGSFVNALEHVVADSRQVIGDKLFNYDADSLWNAYQEYALYAGNQARLLIGQDEEWFEYVAKATNKTPVKQRAMYALLMQRGNNAENRLKGAGLFIKALQTRKNNSRVIQRLFTGSRLYPEVGLVPEPARRALVDIALARQDLPLASRIMATLTEPPEGESSYMWYLRRARLLIMGGKPSEGVKSLQTFIQIYPDASRTKIDRFLQVVFDLQTVGEHDAAYLLFEDVIKSSKDKKLQRELYFWMADSRNAQARYANAAELYLKSAMLLDGKGLDPWGQTARYQAAKALGKAGLLEDAYVLFRHLLRVTKEEDRRAVLRYELQKLQLTKSDQHDANGVTTAEAEAVVQGH